MEISELIEPSGMLAYIFIVLAVAAALLKLRFKVSWLTMKWHMWLGAIAFVFATIHVVIIVSYH